MIYFRADSNSQIGMGHLMRCLSVAQKLKEMTDVSFLCAYEASSDFVRNRGIEAKTLFAKAFSVDEIKEIEPLISEDDLLVLDSYLYDEEYVLALKSKVKVVIFDDMATTPFDVTALINYNTYASLEEYISLYETKDNKPEFLLGGEWAPLRDEFTKVERKLADTVKNILITTGGGDSKNLGGQIASRLLAVLDNDIHIHLICGAANPHYSELCDMANENASLLIHRSINNMAEMMEQCDLAVSAGGSTCYELCATGVPFVVFSFEPNQRKLAENMQENNVAVLAGHMVDEESCEEVMEAISQKVKSLIDDEHLRQEMFEKGKDLVDGKGSCRLANRLMKIMEGEK